MYSPSLWKKEFESKMTEFALAHFWVRKRRDGEEEKKYMVKWMPHYILFS